jgi:hypothetical protein
MVFLSLLTIPFSFFDFAWLISWNGPLTVVAQCMQIGTFVALRMPSIANTLKRSPTDESLSGTDVALQEALLPEENLNNKFIIPGGWPVGILACVSLAAIAVTVLVFSGWTSIVGALGLLAGMWALKGLEIGLRKMIEWCRTKRERKGIEID